MKKRLQLFVLFGVILLFVASSVFASLVSEKKFDFSGSELVWSATIIGESGKEVDISLMDYEITQNGVLKNVLLPVISDGENSYFASNVFVGEDIEEENFFLGCLSGASFTQKLTSILGLLIGKKPYSEKDFLNKGFTREELKEAGGELKKISRTPGTGAYNMGQELRSCFVDSMEKSRSLVDCELSDLCPFSDFKDRVELERVERECANRAVRKFRCGVVRECGTLSPDGLSCGINKIRFTVFSSKKVPASSGVHEGGYLVLYDIILGIDPSTGNVVGEESLINKKEVVSSSWSPLGPMKGGSEGLKVISQEGDLYEIRRVQSSVDTLKIFN